MIAFSSSDRTLSAANEAPGLARMPAILGRLYFLILHLILSFNLILSHSYPKKSPATDRQTP